MVFQFNDQQKLIEDLIKAFLCIKTSENRREALNFITNKGTKLGVSIQTGYSYSSNPNAILYGYNDYKSVEVHNGNPNWVFSQKFINEYADQPNEPQITVYSFVTIEDLASEILLAINNL